MGLSNSLLGKIMMGNSLLDFGFILIPALEKAAIAPAVAPLLSGASESVQTEFVRLISWKFFLHGCVRLYSGYKISSDDGVAYLAMCSYILESLPFWMWYLAGNKVDFGGAAGMMFAPLLMIVCLVLRSKPKFGKQP
mmetsp:Transcript_5420/g.6313  ORF Transcript_5420/g.6313 Transcript_5420/m.6313 type:complete len:137 (-) Transcript_5420:416-826(-)